MNFEICKKCKKKINLYRVDVIINDYLIICGYNKERIDCQCYTNDKSLIDLLTESVLKDVVKNTTNSYSCDEFYKMDIADKLHPSPSLCPYFVEHQMSDWNEV
jgi:hypothetical protein